MDKPILEIEQLTVRFKKSNQLILDNVSLSVFPGDVLSISGKNGSGKTTLLNVITGWNSDYEVVAGKIHYHGNNILAFTDKEWDNFRSKIGYVQQKDDFDGLNGTTIIDLIEDSYRYYHRTKSGLEKVIQKAEALFVYENGSQSKARLNVSPSKLSGGQQRLLSLFLGLVCRDSADLIIIDEPLNNLDFKAAMKISNFLNDLHLSDSKPGMILVTHCKMLTCINKSVELINGSLLPAPYTCLHCMGEPDERGYYLEV